MCKSCGDYLGLECAVCGEPVDIEEVLNYKKSFIREYVLIRATHKEHFDANSAAQTASDVFDKYLS